MSFRDAHLRRVMQNSFFAWWIDATRLSLYRYQKKNIDLHQEIATQAQQIETLQSQNSSGAISAQVQHTAITAQ